MKRLFFAAILLLVLLLLLSSCAVNPVSFTATGDAVTMTPGRNAFSTRFCVYCLGTKQCSNCGGSGKTYNIWTGKNHPCLLCGGTGKCPFCLNL
ncbi:MAG: hypothetical protein IJU56_09360 [Clostridia bacterium]|nr:hypothetical protein [Clostridia bacterium]